MSFVFNPNWQVASWFIDPVNGFDGYTGQNSVFTSGTTGPLKTWAELVARWCTNSPRLLQNTTITFINSHPDNSDPVYFTPYIENGATISLLGTLTVVSSGTLGTVIAKNRSTPQLLNVDFGSGITPAVGQLVINSTHASRAWIYSAGSGTTWNMSQPLVSSTVNTLPIQINTWTAGDGYTINTMTSIYVREIAPVIGNFNSTGNNRMVVQNISFNAGVSGLDPVLMDMGFLLVTECAVPAAIQLNQRQGVLGGAFTNCSLTGAVDGEILSFGGLFFTGGYISIANRFAPFGNVLLVSDIIINGSPLMRTVVSSSYNAIYIESGKTLSYGGSGIVQPTTSGTGSAGLFWGPGSLNIGGTVRLQYPSGTATTTFSLTGTVKINSLTTAYTVAGTNPVTTYGGITINATNLDATPANSSNFNGLAFNPGGASIVNTGNIT